MPRYEQKDPATFKIGDIVEAAVSFALIPNRGGGHSMQTYLRGVTLLDNSFSKVSTVSRCTKKIDKPPSACADRKDESCRQDSHQATSTR